MLPDAIRARVQAMAEQRVGLPLSVGDVRLTARGAELRELHLGAEGDGLDVRVHSVRVSVDPWRLPFDARASIRQFDVGQVEVVVNGPSAALGRVLRARSPKVDTSAELGASKMLPAFSVDGVRLRVRDDLGALIDASAGAIHHVDSRLNIDDASLTLGDASSGSIVFDSVALAARRTERWRLTSAIAAVARVELPARREATAATGGDRPAHDAPDPAPQADLVGTIGGGKKASNSERLDALAPLHRLRALVAHAGAQPASVGRDADDVSESTVALLLRYLSTDARLSLDKGSVAGVIGDKREPMLRALQLGLSRGDDGKWKFEGGARGAKGGRLQWAFAIDDDPIAANGRLDIETMPLPLVANLLPAIPWHAPEHSHLNARLVLETRSVDRVGVSGVVELVNGAIASDRVAPVPVEDLNLTLSGQGYFMPMQRRLEIEAGGLEIADARIDLQGSVAMRDGKYAADLSIALDETSCDKAIRAISPALLGDLVHASWDGTIAGKIALQIDSEKLDETKLEIDVSDRCGFVTVPAIVDLRRFRLPFVHTVLEPDGSVVDLETGPGTTTWTYLDDISPFLVHAVLSHEDSRFFTHGGFSPPHIRNALVKNLEQGRYVVGASTITMQLVKNVFLRREKTLARKTQEVLLTWWIERVMEKRDILELYLNVIEYGPGVYGIRNAAMHYFKRLPSDLSPAEAVYLSTILPNPKKYYGAYERGSISERWAERMRKIFTRLRARGRYTEEATHFGLSELREFRFVKEGEFASARQVPGGTSPLPYMSGVVPWDDEAGEPKGHAAPSGNTDEWGDAAPDGVGMGAGDDGAVP